nr:hypothetical protein [Tanacetum cinerariifolium]
LILYIPLLCDCVITYPSIGIKAMEFSTLDFMNSSDSVARIVSRCSSSILRELSGSSVDKLGDSIVIVIIIIIAKRIILHFLDTHFLRRLMNDEKLRGLGLVKTRRNRIRTHIRQKSGDRHQPTSQQSSHRNHGHNNDRHGSDRRGGSDNHRSNNNNYSGRVPVMDVTRGTGVSSPTDMPIPVIHHYWNYISNLVDDVLLRKCLYIRDCERLMYLSFHHEFISMDHEHEVLNLDSARTGLQRHHLYLKINVSDKQQVWTNMALLFIFSSVTLTSGFPAQSVRSSNAIALDSLYLLVLITEASQSRQHGLLLYLMVFLDRFLRKGFLLLRVIEEEVGDELEASMEDVEGCLWCRGLYGEEERDVAILKTKRWIVVLALQVTGTGLRLFPMTGLLFLQFLGASFTQGIVSSIPIGGSISPKCFLLPILLLVVIIVTVVIVTVILIVIVVVTVILVVIGVVKVVIAIIGVVVVVGDVSSILKLSFVIIGFFRRIVFYYLLHQSLGYGNSFFQVDLIGDEDPTDEDGDTEVSVSLGEISPEGKKSWESNIGDCDNTRDGVKIVGRVIGSCGEIGEDIVLLTIRWLETIMEDVEGCLWCRGLYGEEERDVAILKTKRWIVVLVRSLWVKEVRWLCVLDMQVTLHDKRIEMQVTLHYEAIVMQVALHDKRIVMQVTLHYEEIVMQVTLHDKRIVMRVTLHYEFKQKFPRNKVNITSVAKQ